MTQFSLAELFGMTIRESANDGSDFSNPSADFRRLFLGEDGLLHLKDSAGAVTTPHAGSGAVTSSGLTMATARLLGRTTSSTGAIEEITVGSGLTLAAGTLTASGGAAGALQSARYVRTAGNYTITGAGTSTFANVDGTNLSFTFTTGARKVMIAVTGSCQVNNAGGDVSFDVTVDGTRQGGSTGGLVLLQQHSTASEAMNMSFTYVTAALTAASHTFALQWRQGNTAHTATLYGSDPYMSMHVVELYA